MRKIQIVCIIGVLASFAGTLHAQGTKGGNAEIKEPLAVTGKTYALIVGISDYQSEMIRDLNWAESDARTFANYLKSKSGGNIPAQNVIELYGKDANSTNIWEKGIGYYFFHKKMFKPGDRLLLYFSGHGGAFNNHDRDNAFFFVWDANHATDGDANLKISQIKDLIHTLVEEDVQVVFIFDACRSVDVGVKGGIDQVNKIVEEQQGEILLTASKGGKVAYESNRVGHGIFTYYLVRGLFGDADQEPKDGKIKGYELDGYLKASVRSHSAEEFKEEQVPFMLWGSSNKFEEATLFQYDREEGKLAIAALDLNTTTGLKNSALVAMKGGTKSAVSKAGEYASLFDRALKQDKIIRPADSCAYFYFNQLKKLGLKEDQLAPLRSALTTELMDMARKVINEDLAGKRNYWRMENVRVDGDITLDADYYGLPAEALKDYAELIPPAHRNPSLSSMLAYCQARYANLKNPGADNAFVDMKSYEWGLEIINKELAQNKNKAYLHFAKGVLLNNLERHNEAILSQKEAIRLAPLWTYPVVQMCVGPLASLGMTDSVNHYLNWLKRRVSESEDPLLFSTLGDYERDKKEYDSARYFYKKALAILPNDYRIWHELGRLKHDMYALDSAAYYYHKTLKLNPRFETALANLGSAKQGLNQKDSAEFYYGRALKLDPTDAWALRKMANLKKAKEPDSAVYYFKRLAVLEPKDVKVLLEVAAPLLEKGQLDSAAYYYNKILQLEPTHDQATFAVEEIMRAQNREKLGIGAFSFRQSNGSALNKLYKGVGNEFVISFENPGQKQHDISLVVTGGTFEKLAADRFVIFPDYDMVAIVTANGIPVKRMDHVYVAFVPNPMLEITLGKQKTQFGIEDEPPTIIIPKGVSSVTVVPIADKEFKDQNPREAEFKVVSMEVQPYDKARFTVDSGTIDLKKLNIKARDRIIIRNVKLVRTDRSGKTVPFELGTGTIER